MKHRLIAMAAAAVLAADPFPIEFVSGGPLRGDFNSNNLVDVEDAQAALIAYTEAFAGNPVTLTETQLQAVDVNSDNALTVEDAQWILQYYTENTVAGKDMAWELIIYSNTEICNNSSVFRAYSNDLLNNAIDNSKWARMNTIVSYDAGYGATFMGNEFNFILYTLNSNEIFDEQVVYRTFRKLSNENLNNFKTFIDQLYYVIDHYGGKVDWTKYTIDKSVGLFLNEAFEARANGSYKEFLIDKFRNKGAGEEVLNNSGAMAILYSIPYGVYVDTYLNHDDIENLLSKDIEAIIKIKEKYKATEE